MTFRELELIAFLCGSLVHGSQIVLVSRHLRTTQGMDRKEARLALVSVVIWFIYQFSNFFCVLVAAIGYGYPAWPSKLGNLVRWSTLYSSPVLLSYVVTHVQLYDRRPHPWLGKSVAASRYLLWPWMGVAVASLVAQGTGWFPPLVPIQETLWITLNLMLVFFVIFTVQGLVQRKAEREVPLIRTKKAGLIASLISSVMLGVVLVSGLRMLTPLAPYFTLASMMTTVPFAIYMAYRYHQLPFMDVYIREVVSGLLLVSGLTFLLMVTPHVPATFRVLLILSGSMALIYSRGPLARQVERRLLGYPELLEDQEERLGAALLELTDLEKLNSGAEVVLRNELDAEWVDIGTNLRSDAVHRFEVKGSVPVWLMLGPRAGKRTYMSRQLRLARTAALQIAAQQERLYRQASERRRLVEQHELGELTARAEMRALQAQINPHFLFNSLNVIANLIHDHPERAERLTEQLAEIFRYALESTRRERVSLGDEVHFLQCYLEIERARFGERLRYHCSLDAGAASICIAPMLLQPLVENAVRHGIAPALAGGDLWINARLVDGCLVVEVEDSGVGLQNCSSKPGKGVGLNNVKARILRCYGESAQLRLEARHPMGTRAMLVLPTESATPAVVVNPQEVSK